MTILIQLEGISIQILLVSRRHDPIGRVNGPAATVPGVSPLVVPTEFAEELETPSGSHEWSKDECKKGGGGGKLHVDLVC